MVVKNILNKFEKKLLNIALSENDINLLCLGIGFQMDFCEPGSEFIIAGNMIYATTDNDREIETLLKYKLIKSASVACYKVTKRGIRYLQRLTGMKIKER